jgi:hypothetical protein
VVDTGGPEPLKSISPPTSGQSTGLRLVCDESSFVTGFGLVVGGGFGQVRAAASAAAPRAAQWLAALSFAFWATRSFSQIRLIAAVSSSSSGSMKYFRMAFSSVRATFSL